jgi:hypothetical protein
MEWLAPFKPSFGLGGRGAYLSPKTPNEFLSCADTAHKHYQS